MNILSKRSVMVFVTAIILVAIGGIAAVYSGVYNVAADAPHTRPVYALLETARERSIETRASKLQMPANLDDPERIRQGAGNYNAMCTGCHLTPGVAETELSKGLYPVPPNLTQHSMALPEAFWVIKHGIKASGMPAWGKSMSDEYIWNMAAFLQQLPKLDKAAYDTLVASSGGHSHGGGETEGHAHAGDSSDNHHDKQDSSTHADGAEHHSTEMADGDKETAVAGSETHTHADGREHDHAPASMPTAEPEHASAEPAADSHAHPETEPASDGHDHQH